MKKSTLLLIMGSLLLGGCQLTGSSGEEGPEITATNVDKVETNSTVEHDYGMSPLELGALVLLAGWAIPSPVEMFSGVGSFALKLFGRI